MGAGDRRLRIDRVRTNGVFTLDGQSFDVENNIWLVGDDEEVLIIDAAHEAGPIAEGVEAGAAKLRLPLLGPARKLALTPRSPLGTSRLGCLWSPGPSSAFR